MNKIILTSLLPLLLFSETTVLDFTQFPELGISKTMPEIFLDTGAYGFNWAPELTPYFLLLKEKYNITNCVETGTYLGDSTLAFSRIFDCVDSIELNDDFYQRAKNKFAGNMKINLHYGDSAELIKFVSEIRKDKTTLFYLDAHWNDFWPLRDEIIGISKTHKDNCVIVIDDFKVPNRPEIFFDFYGSKECSYEYVKDALDLVFSDYDIVYLIPKNTLSKAKLVVLPKKIK